MAVNLNKCYATANNLVTRIIEDELVIVPLSSREGDLDAELFSLNTTGLLVWEKLNGSISLEQLIQDIANEFNMPHQQIEKDVVSLMNDLLKQRLIFEK